MSQWIEMQREIDRVEAEESFCGGLSLLRSQYLDDCYKALEILLPEIEW